MASRRSEQGRATLHVRARDERLADAVLALAQGLCAARARVGSAQELDGRRVYVKAGPLGASAGWRHGLRRIFGGALPREREYANLEWLRARGFLAPEPLACAALTAGARARYQMLVTAEVAGAGTLEELLQSGSAPERRAALVELADEVARLHALGWVHRDLFPRNVLVSRAPSGKNLWLIDCWKSGTSRAGRDAAYDLACFLLRAPELLGSELQREFLEHYLCACRARDREPPDRARFLARVARSRARLVARLAARPTEWRGHPAPLAHWPIA